MFGASLGAALGAGVQGYSQGVKDTQKYNANAQNMRQSAETHTDRRNLMAQQIKQAQQTTETNGYAVDEAKQMHEWNQQQWSKYKAAKMGEHINNMKQSVIQGSIPDFDTLNEYAKDEPIFDDAFGHNFRLANYTNPNDVKLAMMNFQGNQDPDIETKVKKMMADGQIVFGINNDGKQFATDLDTLGMLTKSKSAPEFTKIWDQRNMGILTAKSYASIANMENAVSTLEQIAQLETKMSALKAKENRTKAEEDLLDFYGRQHKELSDGYNKEMYGTGGAKDKASIREAQKTMTPEEIEDDNTFRSVSNDKDLISKFGAANDAYDTASTWAYTRDKVFDRFEKANLDWNALANAKGELQGYWNQMTDGDAKEKQKAYRAIKTILGAAMADYIKEMSGAAVSDNEREFLNDLVFGGMWKTREDLESSVNTFLSSRVDKAKRLYEDYGIRVKPNQAKKRLSDLDRMSSYRTIAPIKEDAPLETSDAVLKDNSFLDKAKSGISKLVRYGMDKVGYDSGENPYGYSDAAMASFSDADLETINNYSEGTFKADDGSVWQKKDGKLERIK